MQWPFPLYPAFTFGNETSGDALLEISNSPSTTIFAVFCCLLLILCVVGNVLVVVSFATCPQLRVLNNYWIVSLSMTDIVLALLVLPLQINRELHEGHWVLGRLWCDLFITLDVLCCTCSIYHLCLISLDRNFCLHYPVAHMAWRTESVTIAAIVVTWTLCALISVIRFMGLQDVQPTPYSCIMTNRTYALLSSFLSFYLPLIVIVCMYYSILRKTQSRPGKFFPNKSLTADNNSQVIRLRTTTEYQMQHSNSTDNGTIKSKTGVDLKRNSRAIDQNGTIVSLTTNGRTCTTMTKNMTRLRLITNGSLRKLGRTHSRLKNAKNSKATDTFEDNTGENGIVRCSSLSQRLQKQEKRATKVVLLVLMAFVVLWTPFFTVNLLSAVCPPDTMTISQGTWTVVTWMGYCNSAVNPFIYTYFNRTFRRAMLNVVRMTIKCI